MLNKSIDYSPDYSPQKLSGQVFLKNPHQSVSNVQLNSYNDGTYNVKGSHNGKLPPLTNKARNSNSMLQLSRRSSNHGGMHNKSFTHSQPALHPLKAAQSIGLNDSMTSLDRIKVTDPEAHHKASAQTLAIMGEAKKRHNAY